MNISTPTPPKRRSVRLWFGLAMIYFGAYVILSARGQYLEHNQGGQDNRRTWSPAYCAELYTSPAGRQKLRLTGVGWLFRPPMLVDQWFIHRTTLDVASRTQ